MSSGTSSTPSTDNYQVTVDNMVDGANIVIKHTAEAVGDDAAGQALSPQITISIAQPSTADEESEATSEAAEASSEDKSTGDESASDEKTGESSPVACKKAKRKSKAKASDEAAVCVKKAKNRKTKGESDSDKSESPSSDSRDVGSSSGEEATTTADSNDNSSKERPNGKKQGKKQKTKKKADKDKDKDPESGSESSDTNVDPSLSTTTDTTKSASESEDEQSKDDGWTRAQDKKLVAYKEKGETWASIASALGHHKNEVKARYKTIIQRNAENAATTDTATSATESEDAQSKEDGWTKAQDKHLLSLKEKGETWVSIASALGHPKNDARARHKILVQRGSGNQGAKKGQERPRSGETQKPGKGRNSQSGTQTKSATAHDPAKKSGQEPTKPFGKKKNVRISAPASNTTSSASTADLAEECDNEHDESLRQQRYQRALFQNLYPPYVNLRPDENFVREDCRLLASIDSKIKRGRWLEMQANFMNATGRMLPLEVFKNKMEAAERLQRRAERNVAVERWVDAVERQEQEGLAVGSDDKSVAEAA